MNIPTRILITMLCVICQFTLSYGQQGADSAIAVSNKVVSKINSRIASFNDRLDRQTEKYLRKLEKQELKLQRKLAKLDSSRAAQLFGETKAKYAALRSGLKQKTDKITSFSGKYIPNIDSLGLSLNFLGENSQYLSKLKEGKEKITGALDKYKELQQKLKATGDIQEYIRERKRLLKETLSQYNLDKYLKKFSKDGYYAVKQISEIKDALNDPSKFEQMALKLLNKLPAFKKFVASNSQLAGLFNAPGNYGAAQSVAGLQTRASVNGLMRSQIAAAGPNAMQAVQQNMQQAQAQITQLKDKLSKLGGQSSGDFDIPNFTPNTQKTKTFWQRIRINTDLQTNRGAGILPNIADVAAGLSYKLDDKKQFGAQLVYKAGLGNGLNNIKISHQGFGYRFYGDLKLKKNFWLTGGYESNYMSAFRNIAELQAGSYWQTSALAGLSKKYKLKKKGGEMKILYDFLWNKKIGGQRIVWRTGFTF